MKMLLCLISLSQFVMAAWCASDPSQSAKSNVQISAALLDCFASSPGRALSNAIPSQEFFNVSPEDCLRFCFADRPCNTVVYHKHFSTCQLYSGADEGDGAKEVNAGGHDLYAKKECGGDEKNKQQPEEKTKQQREAEQQRMNE